MYKTKLTTQGTISIPSILRRKYNLQAGEVLTLEDNGKIVISKTPDLPSLRSKNRKYIANKKKTTYRNSDGWSKYVKEKYGR